MKTKEEIKLLEKAICGYLPYKIKAINNNNVIHTITALNTRYDFCELDEEINEQLDNIKLFLRPMSSMTEEEIKEWDNICVMMRNMPVESIPMIERFVNSKHLDYYNLISKDFALEAFDGMYDF